MSFREMSFIFLKAIFVNFVAFGAECYSTNGPLLEQDNDF